MTVIHLSRVSFGALSVVLSLAGCTGQNATRADLGTSQALSAEEAQQSVVIGELLARGSILKPGTSFAEVAEAVLAANARAAEADLRAAKLRAVAVSKNWLPTLGPSISLTSMGDLVAQMIVQQVLFDNGRRKAERAFAAADVEVAAVTLSDDTNARVLTALTLYITAEQGRAQAHVSSHAVNRMREFENIMAQRVEGGVSDISELRLIQQRRSEFQASLAAQQEAAATALAELNAMSARPLDGVRGLSAMSSPQKGTTPLSVLLAEATLTRDVASATAERAGFLPGLTAGGTVGDNNTGVGLTLDADNGLSWGLGARLEALEATKQASEARVKQSREDVARQLASLDKQLQSLVRQEREQALLAGKARSIYNLFLEQYEGGARTVTDVVGVFESSVSADQERVVIKYQIAQVQLQIAQILGLLVDGPKI